jgi:hypothetical protein
VGQEHGRTIPRLGENPMCRVRTVNAPSNFATCRHIAYNRTRNAPGKDSIRLQTAGGTTNISQVSSQPDFLHPIPLMSTEVGPRRDFAVQRNATGRPSGRRRGAYLTSYARRRGGPANMRCARFGQPKAADWTTMGDGENAGADTM